MAEQDNADQVAFWNGQTGEKWARNHAQLDHAFAPLTASLLAHANLRPGEAAIDVGCGCGDLTLAVARELGIAGRVLAIDVSAPMLVEAKVRVEQEGPGTSAAIEWALQDASTHAFAPGAYDLIVSRFGVMFFADPVAAFTNLRRALKSGGRLAMLCWRPLEENAWVHVPRASVLPLVPPPEQLPPGAPGPFGFADADHVRGILARAGFTGAQATKCDAELTLGLSASGSDAEALASAVRFSLQVGPVGSLMREASDETIAAARVTVGAALRPHARDGKVVLGAACWVYTATA